MQVTDPLPATRKRVCTTFGLQALLSFTGFS